MNTRVHQGHLARKRFGQNFLNDQFVIDSIVSAINPRPGQAMVEIGPGLGALTEPVGERMDKLTVIELDRDLAARLQTHPFLAPKLTIYQQDAMTMDFSGLSETLGQPLRVFGNLPYTILTIFLRNTARVPMVMPRRNLARVTPIRTSMPRFLLNSSRFSLIRLATLPAPTVLNRSWT